MGRRRRVRRREEHDGPRPLRPAAPGPGGPGGEDPLPGPGRHRHRPAGPALRAAAGLLRQAGVPHHAGLHERPQPLHDHRQTVGQRPAAAREGGGPAAGPAAHRRAAPPVRHLRRRQPAGEVSPPDLRRHAPADRDRHGPGVPGQDPPGGRAHHRPGHRQPAQDRGADPAAVRGAAADPPLCQPQPGHSGVPLYPRHGHAQGQDRGAGPGGRGLSPPGSPLYPAAGGGDGPSL